MPEKFVKKACMLDISRYRVPTKKRVYQTFKFLKTCGYNQIFFNIEHVFKRNSQPVIGCDADGFSAAEFKQIDRYAVKLGLEITPVIQSFGHMFHIIKWPQYAHLAETERKWSVCMSEETYDFLDSYYAEVAQSFIGEYIHVGGDEVYDMLLGKSAHLLNSGKSKDELFLEHILKLKELATKHGKKICIWDDMIRKNPAVLEKLGESVRICYWNYDFNPFPAGYDKLVNPIYVCPGTQTWKSLFPRIGYSVKNLKQRYEDYKTIGAYGFMVTDWGDAGHLHPVSFSEKMLEMAIKIFNGEDIHGLATGNSAVDRMCAILDEIHQGGYLNGELVRDKNEFVTKHLLHDYIFRGKSLAVQTDVQLQELIQKNIVLQELASNCKFKSEFEKDLEIFVMLTNLLAEKVRINLAFRKGEKSDTVIQNCEMLIFNLRRWLTKYLQLWLKTSQPLGVHFQIHFFKKIETDIIGEINWLKTLPSQGDYQSIEKLNIYDQPEYLNLFSVGNAEAKNFLWNEYRL